MLMKSYFNEFWESVLRLQKRYDVYSLTFLIKLLWKTLRLIVSVELERLEKALSKLSTRRVKRREIRVLFRLTEGIGGILINLNYLLNFKQKICKDVDLDVAVDSDKFCKVATCLRGHDFVSGLLTWKEAKRNENKYALSVELARIPYLREWDPFILCRHLSLSSWVKQTENFNRKYPEYFPSGAVGDGLLTERTLIQGQNRLSQGNVIFFMDEIQDAFRIHVAKQQNVHELYGLCDDGYIVVVNSEKVKTRNYPVELFSHLVMNLKKEFPLYTLVQLGDEDRQIKGVDIYLQGKTDFEEFLSLVSKAKLLIAPECGAVHVRHFAGAKPSVVLFGSTLPEMYGYKENINIRSSICRGCEWACTNWDEYCMISKTDRALCLNSISPKVILDKIKSRDWL